MVDKNYCMSSYLAFRYIEKEDMDFYEGIHHQNFVPLAEEERIPVKTAQDMNAEIEKIFSKFTDVKKGLMLSGGMDSANMAAYMRGSEAYTFRFLGGDFQKEELKKAEYYANYHGLNLHYVDIDWRTVEKYLEPVMKAKAAPVHSIEPQLLQAALQAKEDGVEMIVTGVGADGTFGGEDQLLSRDWTFDDFVEKYLFTKPEDVLEEPVSMQYLFERYRQGDKIDFQSFVEDVFLIEAGGSYMNAFNAAGMPYIEPYSYLKMAEPLDLYRIRHGESKYLVRELFAMNYPEISVPEKVPMPRPVDTYFADWEGPKRPEFKKNLEMSRFTGNQKWQMYCLEQFLNMYEA